MNRYRYSLGYRRASHSDVTHHAARTRQSENVAKRKYVAYCVSRRRSFFPADAQTICEFLRELSRYYGNSALRVTKNGLRAFFLRMQGDDAIQDIVLHFGSEGDALRLAVKQPLSKSALRGFLAPLQDSEPFDLRDRALLGPLVVGLASQESLRMLRVRDVVFGEHGAFLFTSHPLPRVVRLRSVPGPVCLVRALRAWLASQPLGPDDFVFVGRDQRGGFKGPLGRAHFTSLLRKLVQESGYDPRRYGTAALRAHFTFETLAP